MTEQLLSAQRIDSPKVLTARRRAIDLDAYRLVPGTPRKGYRNGTIADVSRVLSGNWLVWDPDLERVVIAYLVAPIDSTHLADLFASVKWNFFDRPDGTASRSVFAGWQVRNPARAHHDQCMLSALHRHYPAAAQAVINHAQDMARWYREVNPELYAAHRDKAEGLAFADYHLEDSPFTGAVINCDSALPYHKDGGNVPEGWSMMLGLKRGVVPDANGDAGQLVIPEYDLALEVENNSVTGFDGQIALHGVTRWASTSQGVLLDPSARAYRYTIVYYARAGMWQCLPPDEEIRYAQKMRTKKELARYARSQEAR